MEAQVPRLTNMIDRDLCNLEIAYLKSAIQLNVAQRDLILFKKENYGKLPRSMVTASGSRRTLQESTGNNRKWKQYSHRNLSDFLTWEYLKCVVVIFIILN
jgi:hypothetical protein